MLKVKTGMRFGKFLLGALAAAGFAGPAAAGGVYSWVTEDGTYAFTDDYKRVPSKHRAEAKHRSMGKLTRYERFTKVSAPSDQSYTDRLRERQAELRESTAVAQHGKHGKHMGHRRSGSPGLGYTIPVGGGGNRNGRRGPSVRVPLEGGASADAEPMVIEQRRMAPSDSLATRNWTIVKRGDKIVSVIKGQRRQRPLEALPEKDFDL